MIKVLDTSLRDGSYVVDFQFSQDDTKHISQTLESFDIEYIEVGHGLGLGAYRHEQYKSLCTDEEYLSAIKKIKSKTKYGVFFIPGIGDFEDIDVAIKNGIDFIRIGTNINESEKAHKYIQYAKSKGLEVAANFMKSYAVNSEEFAKRAYESCNSGAGYVYLVDSAGGMMPNEVSNYIKEAKKVCSCEVGFHGHNNLTLAIANSLAAIDAGATIVDTSLQGLGRDGGNASTEVLLSILMKKDLIHYKNLNALLDYSEVNILPLLRNKGIKSMPLISGIGLFHSGFYQKIKEQSDEYNLDVREIIVKLTNINIIEPTKKDIQKAIKLVLDSKPQKQVANYFNIRKCFEQKENEDIENKIKIILNEVLSLSKKQNKKNVFNIVITETENIFFSNYIQVGDNYIIGSCQINTMDMLKKIITIVDGEVDIIFYDSENKIDDSLYMKDAVSELVNESKLLVYSDTELWVKTIENFILIKCNNKSIIYIKDTLKIGKKISDSLIGFGLKVLDNTNEIKHLDFLVGFDPNEINEKFISFVNSDTIIIDAGIGSISKKFIKYCHLHEIKIIRVDMRVVMETEILQKEKSCELIDHVQGKREINDFTIVAGGYYGKNGDIVVDSIENPTCVIGMSDGNGSVKYMLDENELNIIENFEKEIIRANQ